MPDKAPLSAQPQPPNNGGDKWDPNATRIALRKPLPPLPPVAPVAPVAPEALAAPEAPTPPFTGPDPLDILSQRPTELLGEAPEAPEAPERRLVFIHIAEEHEFEARRLRMHLEALDETIPQRAAMLGVVQLRLEALQRAQATLDAKGLHELEWLQERVPGGLAKLQAERTERARLPRQIAYHDMVAARWRQRAALER
jgi:hypothetical protein